MHYVSTTFRAPRPLTHRIATYYHLHMKSNDARPEPACHKNVQPEPRQRRTTSTALLAGSTELIIEHHGREYRLRITQQGKLILTA